jgi:large subunit ribosomal protein L46
LTRDLTSFEKAFYLYQKRLNERLALPFTRYFYFKKGTPQTLEFKRKVKARQTVARDIGQYNAYAEDGWNDEVQIGSKLGEPEDIIDKIIRDAEGKDIVDAEPQGDAATGGEAVTGNPAVGEGVLKRVGDLNVVRPAPRKTEADSANDQKSLSRAMDRTLYLLVKDEEGHWRFPQDRVYGRENLNQVRVLPWCFQGTH